LFEFDARYAYIVTSQKYNLSPKYWNLEYWNKPIKLSQVA